MKKRKFFIGAAVVLGLLATVQIGRAVYWNSLTSAQKVERVTERMSHWLALSDEQKTRVHSLNEQLAAEKGDARFAFRGACHQHGETPDAAFQKWQEGMKAVLSEEQRRKLRL